MAKLGQTLYYARHIDVNLPDALFVPNSLLNQFRRETAEMLDAARPLTIHAAAARPKLFLRRFTPTRTCPSLRTSITTKRVNSITVTAYS